MAGVLINAPGIYRPPDTRLRINDAFPADNRAGAKHGIAPDLRVVPDDGAEFSEACIYGRIQFIAFDRDGSLIDFYIGSNHAGAEMRLVS